VTQLNSDLKSDVSRQNPFRRHTHPKEKDDASHACSDTFTRVSVDSTCAHYLEAGTSCDSMSSGLCEVRLRTSCLVLISFGSYDEKYATLCLDLLLWGPTVHSGVF
jgi:hypothetical protein